MMLEGGWGEGRKLCGGPRCEWNAGVLGCCGVETRIKFSRGCTIIKRWSCLLWSWKRRGIFKLTRMVVIGKWGRIV